MKRVEAEARRRNCKPLSGVHVPSRSASGIRRQSGQAPGIAPRRLHISPVRPYRTPACMAHPAGGRRRLATVNRAGRLTSATAPSAISTGSARVTPTASNGAAAKISAAANQSTARPRRSRRATRAARLPPHRVPPPGKGTGQTWVVVGDLVSQLVKLATLFAGQAPIEQPPRLGTGLATPPMARPRRA